MMHEPAAIDVSTMPELARLVDEVHRTQQPRRLRRGSVDLAVLVPAPPAREDSANRMERPMTLAEYERRPGAPPTAEELARREELLARIIAHRREFNIAPLTTADLVHRGREEEYESYGGER
jgi:hypothetical protein